MPRGAAAAASIPQTKKFSKRGVSGGFGACGGGAGAGAGGGAGAEGPARLPPLSSPSPSSPPPASHSATARARALSTDAAPPSALATDRGGQL